MDLSPLRNNSSPNSGIDSNLSHVHSHELVSEDCGALNLSWLTHEE